MTLAIGMADRGGNVWVGADCSLVQGAITGKAKEPKVWKQGPWIISGSGDWRPLSIVRLTAELPAKPSKAQADRVVAVDLTAAIRVALTSQGYEYASDDDKGDQVGKNNWLIGLQGVGLWEIDTKWHACRMSMTAIGSPYEFALGWLNRDVCLRYEPDTQIRECIRETAKVFRGAVTSPAIVIGPVLAPRVALP